MGDKAKRRRADELMVTRGLAESLAEAKTLVMAGQLLADEQRIGKPSDLVREDAALRLKDEPERFVSRGGEKLAAALEDFGLTTALTGLTVLDVGASTGGFTQCCLEHGAVRVLAVDVGSNQLAWELRRDPRVTSLEKTDIRHFVPADHPPVDFVVADVSFNGLARLAPAILAAAPRAGTRFLLLVKPQFELARSDVPAGGVVEDEASRQRALEQVEAAFAKLGVRGGRALDARVPGRKGNRELFYFFEAPATSATSS